MNFIWISQTRKKSQRRKGRKGRKRKTFHSGVIRHYLNERWFSRGNWKKPLPKNTAQIATTGSWRTWRGQDSEHGPEALCEAEMMLKNRGKQRDEGVVPSANLQKNI